MQAEHSANSKYNRSGRGWVLLWCFQSTLWWLRWSWILGRMWEMWFMVPWKPYKYYAREWTRWVLLFCLCIMHFSLSCMYCGYCHLALQIPMPHTHFNKKLMTKQRLLISIIVGISDVQVFTLLLQRGKKSSVNPHSRGGEHGAKYNRILPHMRGINHYLNEQIPTSPHPIPRWVGWGIPLIGA